MVRLELRFLRQVTMQRPGKRSRELTIAAIFSLTAAIFSLTAAWAQGATEKLQGDPHRVILRSPEASQQLLVTLLSPAQETADVTRRVEYEMHDVSVASVNRRGQIQPRSEGSTELTVRLREHVLRIPIEVRQLEHPTPVSFREQIIPILTKSGCNSGGCHGKAEGQNGFKLSVFGFDPLADHTAMVKESRGRRISLTAPAQSLLLLKSNAQMPHGGGHRIVEHSLWYRRMARWIGEGAKLDQAEPRPLSKIVVRPAVVVLGTRATQQLQVTAVDADGSTFCVTAEAEFDSNAPPIAGVDTDGLVRASDVAGEAAILVRYMGHVAVARITLPKTGVVVKRPAEKNFVDRLVWDKLVELGLQPSGLADDGMFLRRVFLDVTGRLPSRNDARRFLTDPDPQKRRRVIDHLLERPAYAEYWTMRWSDILRVDKDKITPQGAVAFTRWLRKQFAKNRPYDELVHEILTVRGSTVSETPAAFYQALTDPQQLARSISQVFLGVRIECAQCHHHPFEKWSQRDYFAFAGLFTGVTRKGLPTGGQLISSSGGGDLKHPRTGEPVPAAGLGAPPASPQGGADRREMLAAWVTSAENPFFTRMIVNRIWAHYFGRGLVEPVDDMRATNPATNEPLLAALADHLISVDYNLRAFTRTLLNSRCYQLTSQPNDNNQRDEQAYSHAAYKALPAEILLDALCQTTGIPESFNGWPLGYRAVQIWDNRMPSYFFKIFGRPARLSVCECERGNEPSIAQALHLMNSPEVLQKLRHPDGLVGELTASGKTPTEVIEDLYLTALSRSPSPPEIELMLQAFRVSDSRRAAIEDILWALLNTRRFIYNH